MTTYRISALAADDAIEPYDVNLAWDLAVEPEPAETAGREAKDGKPAPHTGAMVALMLPRPAAAALAVDGGEPVDELHVTLAYLGKAVDVDRAAALAAATEAAGEWVDGPLQASITGVARFNGNDDGVPEVYLVNAVGLAELRTLVVDKLELHGVDVKKDYDFIPHVTRRYLPAGDPALDEPTPPAPEVEWTWTALTVAHGPNQTEVTLDTALELKAVTRRVRTPAGARKYGVPIGSLITLDVPDAPDLDPSLSPAHEAARVRAREKVKALPPVDPELVARRTREAELIREGKLRNGGEHRGNSRDRARSRANLFREFGGDQLGHVPCVHCGLKLHHEDENDQGLPKLVRDKLRVFRDGGGYQLFNLVPSCASCNASRNDKPIDLGPVRPPREVVGARPFGADGRFENDPDVDIDETDVELDGVLVERDVPGDRPHRQRLVNGVPVDEPDDDATKALRRVRTPEGMRRFGLPIGAPIVADLDVPELDEVDPLTDFLSPPAGESAAAKALIPSVAELVAQGMDPAAAVKEHRRLHHNKTVALIRARQKLEKAGQALVAEDAKLPEPPKMPVDADPAVIADWALANKFATGEVHAGVNPLALYDATPEGPNGPGAVLPYAIGQWARRVTHDTETPIPVVGLTVEGHRVERGYVIRRNGVAYLVELGDDEKQMSGLARADAASKIVSSVLESVPSAEVRGMLRGVAVLRGPNPSDEYWAEKYGIPNFTSRATGGRGTIAFWKGHQPNAPDLAHELGHIVDSGLADGGQHAWMTDSTDKAMLVGQQVPWVQSQATDQRHARAAAALGFVPTRPAPMAQDPLLDGLGVTKYGAQHPREDFAESLRLYLKDRREGKLGYLTELAADGSTPPNSAPVTPGTRMDVRFRDLWPSRARTLDAIFGETTPTQLTPYQKAQRKRARDRMALLVENNVAVSTQYIADDHGLTDLGVSELYAEVVREHEAKIKAAHAIHFSETAQTYYKQKLETLYNEELVSGLGATLEDADTDADPDGDARTTALGVAIARLRDFYITGPLMPEEFADFTDEDLANLDKLAQEVANAKSAELASLLAYEAKLQAEKDVYAAAQDAVEFQASIADYKKLPAETAKKIRKKKAAVKFYAKKGGASPEAAQAAADEYELSALADALQDLGLEGTPSVLVPGAAGTPKMVPRIKSGSNKTAKNFRQKRMGRRHPLSAKYGPAATQSFHVGSEALAKDYIVTELAERLNNEADWEVFRAYANSPNRPGPGGIAPGLGGSPGASPTPVGAEPFDFYTAEERRQLLYDDVNERIAQWASTAGDSNMRSLLMQHAIKDEFGLKADWGVRFLTGNKSHLSPEQADALLKAVTEAYPVVGAWYRRVARTMWEHTQEEFAKDGVKELGLYRGMTGMGWKKDEPTRPNLQPANSWTTVMQTARGFGNQILKATLPVSQILGSCVTGFGCLNEHEYVVLDTDGEAMVKNKYAY